MQLWIFEDVEIPSPKSCTMSHGSSLPGGSDSACVRIRGCCVLRGPTMMIGRLAAVERYSGERLGRESLSVSHPRLLLFVKARSGPPRATPSSTRSHGILSPTLISGINGSPSRPMPTAPTTPRRSPASLLRRRGCYMGIVMGVVLCVRRKKRDLLRYEARWWLVGCGSVVLTCVELSCMAVEQGWFVVYAFSVWNCDEKVEGKCLEMERLRRKGP